MNNVKFEIKAISNINISVEFHLQITDLSILVSYILKFTQDIKCVD